MRANDLSRRLGESEKYISSPYPKKAINTNSYNHAWVQRLIHKKLFLFLACVNKVSSQPCKTFCTANFPLHGCLSNQAFLYWGGGGTEASTSCNWDNASQAQIPDLFSAIYISCIYRRQQLRIQTSLSKRKLIWFSISMIDNPLFLQP